MKAEPGPFGKEGEGRAQGPSAGRDRGEMGRVTGIAVHAALAVWNFRDPAALEAHLTAACRRAAAEAQISPAPLTENARRIVARFLASELPERFARAEILGREISILLSEEEKTWWGWIDLLMRERGEIIIADWKTDADENFPRTGPDRYAGQLGVYARAVRRALALPAIPRCELVHIPTATIIPVSIT
jgi:ATP-dependent exoDNAse (exonuclease V) beta subunit